MPRSPTTEAIFGTATTNIDLSEKCLVIAVSSGLYRDSCSGAYTYTGTTTTTTSDPPSATGRHILSGWSLIAFTVRWAIYALPDSARKHDISRIRNRLSSNTKQTRSARHRRRRTRRKSESPGACKSYASAPLSLAFFMVNEFMRRSTAAKERARRDNYDGSQIQAGFDARRRGARR